MPKPRRRRSRRQLPEPAVMKVTSLSHDGRGVAHVNDKVVFIDGALPGEEVMVNYTESHRDYAEGRAEQMIPAYI